MTKDNPAPTTRAKAEASAPTIGKPLYHSLPHDGTICLQIAREFCFELGRAYELIWRAEDYIDPTLGKYDAAARDYKAAYYYVEFWRSYMDLSYQQIDRPHELSFADKLLRISNTFPPHKQEMIGCLHTILLMTSDPKLRADSDEIIQSVVKTLCSEIARAASFAKAYAFAESIGLTTDQTNHFIDGATWAYEQICGEDAPWNVINKIVD